MRNYRFQILTCTPETKTEPPKIKRLSTHGNIESAKETLSVYTQLNPTISLWIFDSKIGLPITVPQ